MDFTGNFTGGSGSGALQGSLISDSSSIITSEFYVTKDNNVQFGSDNKDDTKTQSLTWKYNDGVNEKWAGIARDKTSKSFYLVDSTTEIQDSTDLSTLAPYATLNANINGTVSGTNITANTVTSQPLNNLTLKTDNNTSQVLLKEDGNIEITGNITPPLTGSLLLQNDHNTNSVNITDNTGVIIKVQDNNVNSLVMKDSLTSYINLDTSMGANKIDLLKNTHITGDIVVSGLVDGVDVNAHVNDATIHQTTAQTLSDPQITMTDNTSNAMTIKEGLNDYMTINTTDGSELITFHKDVQFLGSGGGGSVIELVDNTANALDISEGINQYITADTLDGAELVKIHKPLEVDNIQASNTNDLIITMQDNKTNGFVVKDSLNNFISCDSTTGNKRVDIFQDLNVLGDITVSGLVDNVDIDGLNTTVNNHISDSSIHQTTAQTLTDPQITLSDNTPRSLTIKEGINDYLVINTIDANENITMNKDVHINADIIISGVVDGVDIDGLNTTVNNHIADSSIHQTTAQTLTDPQITLTDNTAQAFSIKEGINDYLVINTTDTAESIDIYHDLVIQSSASIRLPANNTIQIDTTNSYYRFSQISDNYFEFNTSVSDPKVISYKNFEVQGTVNATEYIDSKIKLTDNTSDVFVIKDDLNAPYMKISTTTGDNKIQIFKPFEMNTSGPLTFVDYSTIRFAPSANSFLRFSTPSNNDFLELRTDTGNERIISYKLLDCQQGVQTDSITANNTANLLLSNDDATSSITVQDDGNVKIKGTLINYHNSSDTFQGRINTTNNFNIVIDDNKVDSFQITSTDGPSNYISCSTLDGFESISFGKTTGFFGNVELYNPLRSFNTTQSTSLTTGSAIYDGGVSIKKNCYIGEELRVGSNATEVDIRPLAMTSNNSSGYTASSGTGTDTINGSPWKAFNNNLGDFFTYNPGYNATTGLYVRAPPNTTTYNGGGSTLNGDWIQFSFDDGPRTLTKFVHHSVGGNFDNVGWQEVYLFTSTNGTDWVLEEQFNVTLTASSHEYVLTSGGTSSQYWRWVPTIIGTNSGIDRQYSQCAEIDKWGYTGELVSVIPSETTINNNLKPQSIEFFGVSGTNSITIPDNQASAMVIKEGANEYINLVTTDTTEKIEFKKDFYIDGVNKFYSNSILQDVDLSCYGKIAFNASGFPSSFSPTVASVPLADTPPYVFTNATSQFSLQTTNNSTSILVSVDGNFRIEYVVSSAPQNDGAIYRYFLRKNGTTAIPCSFSYQKKLSGRIESFSNSCIVSLNKSEYIELVCDAESAQNLDIYYWGISVERLFKNF